jgi:hypothetical protein
MTGIVGCRARRERPGDCRASKERDELALVHSITSSADIRGTKRYGTLAGITLA